MNVKELQTYHDLIFLPGIFLYHFYENKLLDYCKQSRLTCDEFLKIFWEYI